MILNTVAHNFGHFSFSELISALSNPTNIGIIFSLIVIEGLLSMDNALVLAMMVKHLPEKEQKKSLFYGILGAYAFRFVAIGLGTLLIKLWWIKLFGAFYLLWLSIKYFVSKEEKQKNVKKLNHGFWKTVVMVELMDITFSLDSILAALGISNVLWVLWIGAILGILLMRVVANVLISIVEKYPELEVTAYILIAFIGVKLGLTMLNIHIPDEVFIVVMITLFAGTLIVNKLKKYNVKSSNN